MNFIKIFISLLVFCCLKCGASESSIRAVSMLFRHGDRSPLGTYPNDPYRDYPWPGGYGALSPRGAAQIYKSGVEKAKRYQPLLRSDPDQSIDVSKVLVQSSAIKRCVDSAASFLSGFLEIESPEDLVFVLPSARDEMLSVLGKPCPKFDPAPGRPVADIVPELKVLLGDEARFFKYLANRTGLNTINLRRSNFLDDTLKVHLDNGFQIPEWANAIYKSHLQPLGETFFEKWSNSTRMHLRSGVLLKDMMKWLKAFKNGSNRNIFLYSAHDLTLSSLLTHLDIIDQADTIKPDYGATLAIELHDNDELEDDYEVKIFYFKDFVDIDPIEITIPDCDTPCSFSDFKTNIQPKYTKDYEKECSLEE